MNGCSIINVFTQNGLTNSGGGGGVSDGKVKVDILATADFLGATGSTGALRVDSTFNYTDGGNFVTLGLADNSVTTAKITDANVTYAKVQNVGAVSLLGNPTGSAISVSEITLGSGLSFNSTTLEVAIGTDVQAWNSKLDTFSALADGSNGQVLQTNGAGAYSWVTISGSGNVSSALDFTTDDRLVLVDFTSGAKNVKQSSVLLSDVSLNSDNLSNLANASTSRTNLGVAIGTDVQAWNSKLDVFSALADGTNGQVLATNGAGVYSWVTISGSVSDGDKGDITVSSSGSVWTIDNNAVTTAKILNSNVTLAKIEDISTSHFLGRHTGGSGAVQQVSASQARTILNVEDGADVTDNANVITALNNIASVAEGDILYYNGSNWVRLARGTDGQVLTATATTVNWENVTASAPTWTTATASTATSASIDLSTNYYVEVDGDADFNLTTIDTTDLQTGIRHLLVFIPSGATRTVTNGLTSMDNFGGAIPVTTSERLVLEIFKDDTGNVNIAGSVVS